MNLYKKAFGEDFELGIKVPSYFCDQSYKNDTCPRFIYEMEQDQFVLWVDYMEPLQREVPDLERYTLELRHQGGAVRHILSTDSTKVIEEAISSMEYLKECRVC